MVRLTKGRIKIKRSRAGTGFTLIELLVAVTVIAVGMIYVLAGLARCATLLSTSERMVTGTFLLDNKLWQLDEKYREYQGADMTSDNGVFAEPYEKFMWAQSTTQVSADLGDQFNQTTTLRDAVLEETVTVSWKQGRTERDVSTTRFVVRRQEGP